MIPNFSSTMFRSAITKVKNVIGFNNSGSFYNATLESKIRGIVGLWSGISLLVGCNGAICEHKRIRRFAYNQYMITEFDKFMISVDLHIKASIIYAITFLYYPITYLIFGQSYFDIINRKRKCNSMLLSEDVDSMPEK